MNATVMPVASSQDENSLITPAGLGQSFLVLRCYINDHHYAEVETDKRTIRDAKKQAMEVFQFFPQVILVTLVGLDFHTRTGRPKVIEKFRMTRVHAYPFYVDHREKWSGVKHTERFATRQEAIKVYRGYLSQDLICSTNACGATVL